MGKYCDKGTQKFLLNRLVESTAFALDTDLSSKEMRNLEEHFSAILTNEGIFNNRNLIDKTDYIACTVWSKDDIRCELDEKGYEASDENVQAVIDSGLLHLDDCFEEQWDNIDYAIRETLGNPCEREDY